MIPPAFDYHAPKSVGEAIALLGQYGSDAKILAGGHSLLPMMKLRFAQPAHLIDINRIAELRGICEDGADVVIGAMTVENDLIASPILRAKVPLLAEAPKLIADPQVRNRGTIGGDIAHGDPGNDHPALAIAVDTGWAYEKLKRKTGDWATAGAAVVMRIDAGRVTHCRIALTNVAPMALRATDAERALLGQPLTDASVTAAAQAAMAICDPAEDLRGDREYKTAMAGEMVKRAIRAAAARCQ